jgi:hypothetical protein
MGALGANCIQLVQITPISKRVQPHLVQPPDQTLGPRDVFQCLPRRRVVAVQVAFESKL